LEEPFVPIEFGPSLLTNVSLAVIALITTGVAIWIWVRRSSAALAPVVLAVPLLLIAVFGAPLWEWSKASRGAGLGPDTRAVPFAQSIGATALLWACIGAGLSALLLPAVGRGSKRIAGIGAATIHSRKVSILCFWGTLAGLVIWIIGTGPSFLARNYYLQTDGVTIFLLVGWPLAFLTATVSLVWSVIERDRLLKFSLWAVAAMVYIVMAAVGTRMALVFPAVAALVLIAGMVRDRRLYVVSLVAAVALLGLSAFTFSVVYAARVVPHGLLNMPDLVRGVIDRSNGLGDLLLTPVKQLGASIFVAYPLAERSAQQTDLFSVLIANANPLPGTSLGRGFETYWPYSWVPLAFVGTWFGATGWMGQVLLFCFMGWTTGYTIANFERSKLPYASFMVIPIVLALGALSIEYSSRNVWRVLSIAVVLLAASYAVRRKRARSSPERGVDVVPGNSGQDALARLLPEPAGVSRSADVR
jgi:iron complex transport system permease protein